MILHITVEGCVLVLELLRVQFVLMLQKELMHEYREDNKSEEKKDSKG